MKKISLLIFILFLSTFLINCSLIQPKYDYTFENNSDYYVTISPNGQDWESFTISPGETRTISINYDTIYFYYDNADYVYIDNSVSGYLLIYNKTLLQIKNYSSVDLQLVQWNDTYFGQDLIWDNSLSQYFYGLKAYTGNDIKEVNPGVDYIYFYYPDSSTQYRTVDIISVKEHEQWLYIFYDSTQVQQRDYITEDMFLKEEENKIKKVIYIDISKCIKNSVYMIIKKNNI